MNHIINWEEMEILGNKGKGLQKRVQKEVQSYGMGYELSHICNPLILAVPLGKGTSMTCSKDEQQD